MPPPPPIPNPSFSLNPASNAMGQGDFTAGSSQDHLPSFHHFGGKGRATSPHIPGPSSSPYTWKDALKGWEVIFGSCRSCEIFNAGERLVDCQQG